MGLEQRPEEQAHSPPKPEEVWYLKEEEMMPEEVKALGHFLYGAVIDVVEEREFSTRIPEMEEGQKKRKKIDPGLLPTAFYVEGLASEFGLNVEVMKRWTNRASIELAKDNLLVMSREYERQRQPHPEFAAHFAAMIEHVEHVARDGIQAAYIDHLIAYNASKTWGKALKQSDEDDTTAE